MQGAQIIIHEASAGSGKTFTLVKNYLSICLDPTKDIDVFQRILAITFTNKAAKEMKDRIINQLEAFLKEEKSSLFLAEEFKIQYQFSDIDFKERCFALLQKITHNYSSFSVSTIDKFMLKIIRSIRFELGLKDNLEVLSDTEEWFEESTQNLLDEIEHNKDLEAYFEHRLQLIVEDGKSWNLKNNLKDIAKNILDDNYQKKYQKILSLDTFEEVKNIRNDIKQQEEEILNNLQFIGEELQNLISKLGLTPESFTRKSARLINFSNQLRNKEFTVSQSSIKDILKYTKSRKFFNKDKFVSENTALNTFLNENEDTIAVLLFRLLDISLTLKQLNNIEFDYLLNKKLQDYLEENSYIPIASFNSILENFIDQKEIPMLLMKMGEKYEHIFIDEFQDTSQNQWHNLFPLLENILSKGHKVHLIGDAKQSIYSWRGGDVNILLNLKNNRQREIFEIVDAPVLSTNWRSYKQVVAFNNNLYSKTFNKELQIEKYQNIYQQAKQKIKHQDKEGYVEMHYKVVDKKTEDIDALNLNETLNRIQDIYNRNHTYNGICLLLRGKEEISRIADFLLEKEIPFLNSESLRVFSDDQNVFIKDVLFYFNNPHSNTKKESILRYIFDNKLKLDEDYSTWYIKNKQKDISDILKPYSVQFPKSISNNFLETMESIIQIFNLKSNLYVYRFLEIAQKQISYGNIQLNSFLELCKTNEDKWQINLDNVDNAVQIMTVHKSKGLEFPYVIIPFLNKWKTENPKSKYWFPSYVSDYIPEINDRYNKELLDLLPEKQIETIRQYHQQYQINNWFDIINLLYVATTRAVKELYILNYCLKLKNTKDKVLSRDSISLALANALVDSSFWETEETISYGIKTISAEQAKKKHILKEETISNSSKNWGEKIKIATNIKNTNWLEKGFTAQEIGNHIHQILANIKTLEDIEKACESYFSRLWIPENERNKWKNSIVNIINIPEIKPYFSKEVEVLNERDWLAIDGSVLRPDRVVCTPENELIIIDYKTGAPKKEHQKQIENYNAQLSFSDKYAVKKSVLVYTETMNVIEF